MCVAARHCYMCDRRKAEGFKLTGILTVVLPAATPTGMNSWMGPNGGVPDYSGNATLAELTAQLGAYSQEQLAAAVRATRPDSAGKKNLNGKILFVRQKKSIQH